MASIAPAPIIMNNAILKIGTDNYEKAVSSAKLVPNTPMGKFQGIDGTWTIKAGTPSWELQLEFAQDWTTANSLSQYLATNAGLTKSIELTPETGGAKKTVTVTIIAGSVGGAGGTTTLDSVTLSVNGQPTTS